LISTVLLLLKVAAALLPALKSVLGAGQRPENFPLRPADLARRSQGRVSGQSAARI
jgi:hypothetical protein